jgi:hypothetical protein
LHTGTKSLFMENKTSISLTERPTTVLNIENYKCVVLQQTKQWRIACATHASCSNCSRSKILIANCFCLWLIVESKETAMRIPENQQQSKESRQNDGHYPTSVASVKQSPTQTLVWGGNFEETTQRHKSKILNVSKWPPGPLASLTWRNVSYRFCTSLDSLRNGRRNFTLSQVPFAKHSSRRPSVKQMLRACEAQNENEKTTIKYQVNGRNMVM